MDVGMSVLRLNNDETLDLIDYKPLSKDRQVELEVELSPGNYIVLPRTTGGLMTKSKTFEGKPKSHLLHADGSLSKAFENVINDIFRKFDLFIGRELSYEEFKVLYQCTGKSDLTEQVFKTKFLTKYCSTSEGLTVRGLQHFF